MLIGEYRHSLDEKNRLIIPSKFRDSLNESCIVTKGLENSLFIYSISEWEKITSKLNTLPFTKKDARNFTRFFLSGACLLEFDKQGRAVIPNNLKEHANLIKECVIIGVGSRIEIWSKENWDKFESENNDAMADIAEHLFDGDSYAL